MVRLSVNIIIVVFLQEVLDSQKRRNNITSESHIYWQWEERGDKWAEGCKIQDMTSTKGGQRRQLIEGTRIKQQKEAVVRIRGKHSKI